MAAEKLRDLSQPIDVALLDATLAAFYGTGSKEEKSAADLILRDLQNNPNMWLQVVHILSSTQQSNTKFFSLQVLEGVIKNRWNALPVEQRDGLKNYIFEAIVKLSSDETSFHHERLYVNKLNITLVQILKHEWPARWRSFIPDLVAAAKTSETICENCMAILKILSEEVFDFSRGEMTQLKIKELKQSLNSEFQLIHELCLYVLSASQRTDLIRATLATLHAFLCWIPLGSIFESPLLETLLKFFPVPAYRNLTLQCLTEVAPLSFGEIYNLQYVKMYCIFMMQLQGILPLSTNIPETYASGNSEEQAFIQNLALFFTSFFKSHIRVLESTQESISTLLMGLEYLINISYVDDTDVFKVCLDYWYSLVLELSEAHHSLDNPVDAASLMGLQIQMVPGVIDGLGSQLMQRPQLYAEPMSKLRLLMISRMAKPEEVLIVEDENGNIVRETMKDNDVLAQYKLMRETLICLSHLDHNDTEKQMLRKLSKQLNCEDWTWNNLNTLCWAIGSISGSMMEEQENRFLVMVIRDLLNLCEITKGKDNKAVIASSIMYVAGQYPRFLGAHWKFLKTVVNKLFEFMHEAHPGVQDMACDTFLKIVQKCKGQFVVVQLGENEPFLSELLTTLPVTITDLDPHQIHTFYESVAHTIQAEPDPQKRDEYLQRLMVLPNQRWNEIIGQARQSVDFLKDQDVIRAVLNILQTNTSVATALGTYFLSQISVIFLDMLNVYRMCSELISTTIAQRGRYASERSIVKLLRSVKRETLKFIETFLDKAEDQPQIGTQFVPPMMDHVLGDYARNSPDARESEVLSLFATIINKYKGSVMEDVPRIFEAVIQCTMEMINQNFEDYPEYRLKFFSLLRAIATHCFPALIRLSSEQLKLVMDSIIRAFRHTERNIAETGLNLLLEMLKNFQVSEFCNQFYRAYFLLIEQEIFAVLKDTFYKPLFKLHVLVLEQLFCLVESGLLTEPLWDVAATVPSKYPNNGMFVREYTINLLITSFPNTTSAEVTQFVNGLFESLTDLPIFENRIRDFLVQSKARNMSVEHIDDLSDLPCELLIEIAKRVKKIEDFVSFRCVSKSLFAAAKDEYFKGLFLRQQTPYLMLPVRDDDGDDDVREIYSLVDGGSIVASARVPNFKNKKCLESLGWLLVTEADGSMSLLEPFSGTEIPLPHQNTFEYYDSTTEDVFGFFHKMVLTSRPIETSDFVLIVILGRRRYLGYWRPGLSSFAGWQLIEFNSGVYFDVVYHGDGNFYAISYPGYVSAFNVSADAYDMGGRKVVSFMPKNVKFPTLDESLPTMLGVVQGGEAFMNVLVHRKQLYLVKTVDGSVLIITRSSPIWGLDDPTSTTTGFLVYEVDTSMGTFKEIYSLGNMAVFLGHNSTTAVDASRYQGGVIKPNHIYFTDDNWEFYHHLEHGGGMDSGVYDMETRTIEPLYPEVLCSTVSPSFWITPSPCI